MSAIIGWNNSWCHVVLDFSNNLNVPKYNSVTSCYDIKRYLKSISIEAGFSRYDFHRLENLAIVAPSITLWSADQLTFTMCALYTLSLSSNFGTSCMRSDKTSCKDTIRLAKEHLCLPCFLPVYVGTTISQTLYSPFNGSSQNWFPSSWSSTVVLLPDSQTIRFFKLIFIFLGGF